MSRLTTQLILKTLVMDMWLHQSEFLIPLHPIPSQNLCSLKFGKVIVTDEFLLILETS